MNIDLFRTHFSPERNMVVEDMYLYLNDLYWWIDEEDEPMAKTITDIQLIPIELETKIVIEWKYHEFKKFKFNYARYKYGNGVYYYFITRKRWKSDNSLELTLKLDTFNTYYSFIDFTKKTKIIREHQDRFVRNASRNKNYRKIQRFKETDGINLNVYEKTTLYQRNTSECFYLLYKSNLDPESAKVSPINCYLASDNPLFLEEAKNISPNTLSMQELFIDWLNEKYGQIAMMGLDNGDNCRVKIYYNNESGGVSFKEFYLNQETILLLRFDESITGITRAKVNILYYKYNPNTYEYEFKSRDVEPLGIGSGGEIRFAKEIEFIRSDYIRVDYIANDTTNYFHYLNLEKYERFTGKVDALYTKALNEINRSDPKNIKFIKLPYAPDGMSIDSNYMLQYEKGKWVYDSSIGLLRLKDLNSVFNKTAITPYDAPITLDFLNGVDNLDPNSLRDDSNESKMYHSDFFRYEFIYDSFIKDINMENLNSRELFIEFKVSNTINSNFLFDFTLSKDNYLSSEAYPNVLIIKRNNEIPIYTSAYTNYINNGYNYDKKNAERNKTMSWINTGLSIGGGVLSMLGGDFGVASGIGLLTGGLQSIASNIANQNRAEQDINQKLHGSLNSAANVSGSDDIDLLDFYSDNKLMLIESKPSPEMRKCWLDMFYYYGYYYPVQEKPNITSRYWFNFLQCEPDFARKSYDIPSDFLEDIRRKLLEGVTFYHVHYDQENAPIYDFEQEKENAEVWLVK